LVVSQMHNRTILNFDAMERVWYAPDFILKCCFIL
jgi:hypothetical protein